ncbi:hypothetical protein [Mesorhizobium sp. 43Arga]
MWPKIKTFFLNSEPIFLARLQAFSGVVVRVLLSLDPGLFQRYVLPKWLLTAMRSVGVLTDYSRHWDDPTLGSNPSIGKVQ